jgi:hypothetical protein
MIRTATWALLIVALHTPAARAQAPGCADADADEQRAQQLREEGRDLDAVRLLESVVACERTPRRVGRLGLAEAAAGLWVPSEAHLAEALAGTDPWVRRVRRELGVQLARVRERVGNLEVLVNAPRGELRIGGATAAALPMRDALRVPAGALTYEIVAPGFVREVRRVDITAGFERLTRENVALTPEPAVPTPTAEPPPRVAPAPAPPVAALPAPTPAPTPATTPRPAWMRPAAIAATAVGGALAGTGVVALVLGSSAAETYNDDARCFVPGRGRRDAQCGDERSTAEAMRALAVAGFVGAAVLLGAGVGLFAATPSERPPRVSLGAGPGDLGVSLQGRF